MILVTHCVTFCPNIIADNIKNLLAWKSYILYVHTHMTQSHIQRQARPVLKTSTDNHFNSGHLHQLHKSGKTRHHRQLAADLAQHNLNETTRLHSSHFHMLPCQPSLLAGDSSTTEASSAFPLICELWLVWKWQCFFVMKHLKSLGPSAVSWVTNRWGQWLCAWAWLWLHASLLCEMFCHQLWKHHLFHEFFCLQLTGSPKFMIRLNAYCCEVHFCPHSKVTVVCTWSKDLTLDLRVVWVSCLQEYFGHLVKTKSLSLQASETELCLCLKGHLISKQTDFWPQQEHETRPLGDDPM